jgi:hypothetical protein
MELSGENHRSVSETRNFSFYSSFSPEGKTGVGLFALSGENKKIQFDFESGRLIDPSGRYVYSYGDLEPIEISGDVETTGYSYYINNEPFAYGNIKDNFKLQKFCYDSTGMQFSLVDTEIRGTAPSYYLEFPNSFIISGYHTGHLVNNSSDLGFKVLSAKPLGDFSGFWNVTSFDKTIAPSSSGKIVVQDLSGAVLYQNNEYSLVIDTNFGNITTGVSGIANPSDFKRVHFNVTKGTSGISSTGLTNVNDVIGGGNIWTDDAIHHHNSVKFNTYFVDYVAYSGTSLSGNKPLHVSLEYVQGTTGDFFGGPDGSVTAYADHVTAVGNIKGFSSLSDRLWGAQYTGSVTGLVAGASFIEGSGYVGNHGDFNLLSGIAHTGSVISGYAPSTGSLFVYASGVAENSIMSGVTGISDSFESIGGAPATGSGLLAEYYNGSWLYGSEYVATTGLLDGFFTGRDIVAADYGSKFYEEYITGTIDALTVGGTAGSDWGVKLVNSSLKAPSHPTSGVTGVTSHSGYWTGDVVASGLTNFSGYSNYTGLLSGYKKSFTGSFDMSTGTSGSFLTSGYYWGPNEGNVGDEPYTGYKIYPDPYTLSSGEVGASVTVKFSSNYDLAPIVALLTISGMDNNVYQDYLTGIR